MDWVSDTVNEFGRSIGVPGLELDEEGCMAFALEPEGLLGVHDLQSVGGSEVLVSLAKPLPLPAGPSVRRALAMADFRVSPKWQLQMAIRGPDLVATLRTPRHSFLMSALEDAIDSLFLIHAHVAQTQ